MKKKKGVVIDDNRHCLDIEQTAKELRVIKQALNNYLAKIQLSRRKLKEKQNTDSQA